MSNEDNDDVNDSIMDESAARGTSSIQALGMNGSDIGGIKGDPDSSNIALDGDVADEKAAIEVVSDDGGEGGGGGGDGIDGGADDDYQDDDDQLPTVGLGNSSRAIVSDRDESRGGYWGAKNNNSRAANGQGEGNAILGGSSRPVSPGMMDNLSDISSQMPITAPLTRSKSRSEFNSSSGGQGVIGSNRYSANFWKARRVLFYRNGDPFFPGTEYRFKPGRDVTTIEALLDKLSPRMDLPRGARFIFSMDGDRKYSLDELEDGASYVVSSFNKFKVGDDLANIGNK